MEKGCPYWSATIGLQVGQSDTPLVKVVYFVGAKTVSRCVQLEIEKRFGGKAIVRQAKAKAGPLVTDNGNFIIDWHFDSAMKWEEIGRDLNDIPG